MPKLAVLGWTFFSLVLHTNLLYCNTIETSYNIKNSRKQIRSTAVSRIKQQDFGLQNSWTLGERAALTALTARAAFKVWKYLRNEFVLPVQRISYFLHFSLSYVVYSKGIIIFYDDSPHSSYYCSLDSQKQSKYLSRQKSWITLF